MHHRKQDHFIILYQRSKQKCNYHFSAVFDSLVFQKMLVVSNGTVLVLHNVFGHSQGEAVDQIRCIGADYSFLPWLIFYIGYDVPDFLNPVAEEVDALLVIEAVWGDSHEVGFGVEVLAESLDVDVLLEVEMIYSPVLLLEALRPLGGVDELHPKLVELTSLQTDYSHEEALGLKGARDGFPHMLDIVDPMEGAEADNGVPLLNVIELLVQVLFEKFDVGLFGVFLVGNFDEGRRDVISVILLHNHSIFFEFFLHVVGLFSITAPYIENRNRFLGLVKPFSYQLYVSLHWLPVHLILCSIPLFVKFIEGLSIGLKSHFLVAKF